MVFHWMSYQFALEDTQHRRSWLLKMYSKFNGNNPEWKGKLEALQPKNNYRSYDKSYNSEATSSGGSELLLSLYFPEKVEGLEHGCYICTVKIIYLLFRYKLINFTFNSVTLLKSFIISNMHYSKNFINLTEHHSEFQSFYFSFKEILRKSIYKNTGSIGWIEGWEEQKTNDNDSGQSCNLNVFVLIKLVAFVTRLGN